MADSDALCSKILSLSENNKRAFLVSSKGYPLAVYEKKEQAEKVLKNLRLLGYEHVLIVEVLSYIGVDK